MSKKKSGKKNNKGSSKPTVDSSPANDVVEPQSDLHGEEPNDRLSSESIQEGKPSSDLDGVDTKEISEEQDEPQNGAVSDAAESQEKTGSDSIESQQDDLEATKEQKAQTNDANAEANRIVSEELENELLNDTEHPNGEKKKPEPEKKLAKDTESGEEETVEDLRAQIEAIESERDDIQEEYDGLLEKVSTIKQRLGEKFKELEADANKARQEKSDVNKQLEECQKELKEASKEVELARKKAAEAKEEAEEKTSLHDLEVHSLREQLVSQKIMFDQEISNERMSKQALELELEQLKTHVESNTSLSSQTAKTCELQEIEIAKLKRELHVATEEKETLEAELKSSVSKLTSERDTSRAELAELQAQLVTQAKSSASSVERQVKLETEAKENQLLIGKLRHEAVILNDHLTHALRLVRKDSEGSTVDKELVSNLFVQFATCPRQDTKKYEILLLIANFLEWDDERRKLVGLSKGFEYEYDQQQPQQPTQMVGVVGKLAEFIESRRNGNASR